MASVTAGREDNHGKPSFPGCRLTRTRWQPLLQLALGSCHSCGQHLGTLVHSTARRDRGGVSRGQEGMAMLHHKPSCCPLVAFLSFFFSHPSF